MAIADTIGLFGCRRSLTMCAANVRATGRRLRHPAAPHFISFATPLRARHGRRRARAMAAVYIGFAQQAGISG
jgi:hypothetical protein